MMVINSLNINHIFCSSHRLLLSLLMIAFNLIGDGLRDALDPKMKD